MIKLYGKEYTREEIERALKQKCKKRLFTGCSCLCEVGLFKGCCINDEKYEKCL